MPARIQDVYLAWNNDGTVCRVIIAPTQEIALEIAQYLCGDNPAIAAAYDNSSQSVHDAVAMFRYADLRQGYLSESRDAVEYKTRKQMIDDVLNDLEPRLSLKINFAKLFW